MYEVKQLKLCIRSKNSEPENFTTKWNDGIEHVFLSFHNNFAICPSYYEKKEKQQVQYHYTPIMNVFSVMKCTVIHITKLCHKLDM